jgi:hypothetical protein
VNTVIKFQVQTNAGNLSEQLSAYGARGSIVVKALCYKPEGHEFDTLLGTFLNLLNPSCRNRPWGLLSL